MNDTDPEVAREAAGEAIARAESPKGPRSGLFRQVERAMAELSSDSADFDDKQLLRCMQHPDWDPMWDPVDAEFRREHHDLTTAAPVGSGCRG